MPGGAGSSLPDDEDDPAPGIAGKPPLRPPGIPPDGIPPHPARSQPPAGRTGAPPDGPPRSPAAPAACGPASTIGPPCGVAAVSTAKAAGAANSTREPGDRCVTARSRVRPQSACGEPGAEQQRRDAHRGRDQDEVTQPRRPVRGAVQQRVRPDPGDGRHRDEQPARTLVLPGAPQLRHDDPDERGDRRSQRHRVVLVEDAAHVAEHAGGDQQPPTPQQHRRSGAVRAGRAAGQPQPGDQGDQGGRAAARRSGVPIVSLNIRPSPVAPPKPPPPPEPPAAPPPGPSPPLSRLSPL